MKFERKYIFLIVGILIAANVYAWAVVYELQQSQPLEVVFFDVGQGDSIFIETPQKYQILIDGGPGNTVLEKLGQEMPFWDRTIDLVVLTHPEHDHMAGLIEVLKRYEVDNILWTGVLRDTGEYEEWERLIGEEEVNIAELGQRIITPELFIEVLHPFENLEGKEVSNTNNSSVVLRLVFEDNSFLFTGDLYSSVEKEIVDRGLEIDSDVLKVGHHGSKTSTGQELLEKVTPQLAVISVGKDNQYGHPNEEVLESLDKYGITVLRTDEQGDIKIISDGQNIKIR